MKFSNGKTERIAVGAITSVANTPGSYLIPNIPVGDKGVSLDGDICVFIDDSEKKESYLGIVPVQVKGTQVTTFQSELRSFSLEMDHYRNYLKTGGVLLLVVEMTELAETKIFYKSLLPLELSEIIKTYGSQGSKSVQLRALGETTLYNVCRKFLNEQQNQPIMLVEKKPFPVGAFSKYEFTSLTFDPQQHAKSIFDHDFNIYGVVNESRFPLQIGRIAALGTTRGIRFEANSIAFHINTEIKVEQHVTTFIFEDVVSFTIDEKNKKFSVKFLKFKSLAAQLITIPFLIEVFSGNTVEFDRNKFALNDDAKQIQSELEEVTQYFSFLKELEQVFHILGIEQDTLFMRSEDISLHGSFVSLINTILHNDMTSIKIPEPDNGTLIELNLGQQVIGLFYNPANDKKFINAFSKDMLKIQCTLVPKDGGTPFPHTIYTMLHLSTLEKSVNINPSIILESFDQIDPFANDAAVQYTNDFCLKCINAFDKNNDFRLLDVASSIYSKYSMGSNVQNEAMVLINQYQIQLRILGRIEDKDLEHLYQLKTEAIQTDNNELLFCINVLLNNSTEAKLMFSRLHEKVQDYCKELPIFTLYDRVIKE